MAVHTAVGFAAHFFGCQMRHKLVTIKVEVHPVWGAAAFFTANHLAIKFAGYLNVGDRECKVEGLKCAVFGLGCGHVRYQ